LGIDFQGLLEESVCLLIVLLVEEDGSLIVVALEESCIGIKQLVKYQKSLFLTFAIDECDSLIVNNASVFRVYFDGLDKDQVIPSLTLSRLHLPFPNLAVQLPCC
jgi:hypothetical protein